MLGSSLILVLVLGVAPAANGQTWIELAPQTPGPYAPGASADVDVILHNMEGHAIQPRLMSLDWSHSDAALNLPSVFHFQLVPPLFSDAIYSRFEAMPKVDIIYAGTSPMLGFILDIPHGSSHTLGTIHVGLPDAWGTYLLDALNPTAGDTYTGARVDYGFAAPTTLHSLHQNLEGGLVGLTVIPEPGTVGLLVSGGLLLNRLGRRRTR